MKRALPLFIAGIAVFCARSAVADVCLEPKDAGPCRALALKFFFNPDTKRCEILRYGGCKGNGNNFNSLRDCHTTCQRHLEDPSAGLEVHLKSPQCTLPPEDGDRACFAAIPKWTFNSVTGRCERYVYGGCFGTQNLYNSQRACMQACVHDAAAAALPAAPRAAVSTFRGARVGTSDRIVFPDSDSICDLPPIQPGPFACTAFKPMWTFDGRQGKCVEYVYGGCRGTKNLFETEAACRDACPAPGDLREEGRSQGWTRPEFCNGPQVSGNIACTAAVPKWTFNKESQRCERYIYGGCHGTANVFDSESECVSTCDRESLEPARTLEVCALPIEPGPCKGQRPKIGFNPKTQRCERFFYGGCKGNDNRFNSVEECVNTCGGLAEPEDNPLCALVQCDPRMALVNRAKGCVPIAKPGECCPSEWDCSAWEERLLRKDQCFLVSRKYPKGKYYDAGEPMPEATDPCRPDCTCGPDGQPFCPQIMCDFIPLGPKPDPSCVRVPGSPEACCATDRWVCGEEAEAVATCEVGGKLFRENEYIDDALLPGPADPCRSCYCQSGWDGSVSERFCRTEDHPLGLNDKNLQLGCEPVFREGSLCRPTGWICPPAEPDCDSVECDWKEIQVNTAKGCVPRYNDGECCPAEWDCSTWEERLRKPDQCFFVSDRHPRGKFYNRGDEMPEAESKCQRACTCGFDGHIMCAMVDCFPPPSVKLDDSCQFVHEQLDECCSGGGWKCGEELEALATCEVNGTVYYEGQYIEDKDTPFVNPCTSCICRAGWDGSFSDKFCRTVKNPLGLEDDWLRRGCLPVRKENVCGAVDWNCPSIQPPQIPDGPPLPPVARPPPPVSSSIVCPPGVGIDFANLPETALTPAKEPLDFGSSAESDDNDNNDVIAVTLPERLPRTVEPDVCLLPKAQGPCKGFKDMWYFDTTDRRCKMYKYGGFTMFGNVFVDEDQCKTTCFKYLLDDGDEECKAVSENNAPGRSDRCLPFQRRFRFNRESGKCEDFTSRGCGENFDSYRTIEECEARCVKERTQSRVIGKQERCNERVAKGNCRSQLRRFYFDEESGKCKLFLYSGCQGNGNNFLTERECTRKCVPDQLAARSAFPQTLEIRDPCRQAKEVGPCLAMKPRFFYDEASRTCRLFFYGGCGGNANNFRTLRDCADTCAVDPVNQRQLRAVCREPKKVGPCRAMAKRWFFNSESGKCEKFVFGGCRPNGNNFEAREDCLAACEFTIRNGGVRRKSPFITVGGATTLPIAINGGAAADTPPATARRSGPFIEVGGAATLPIALSSEEAGDARIIEVGLAATLPERIDPLDNPCMLDKVVGRCKAAMPRFYFDRETKKCQRFIYGGCGGNGNNFGTLDQCLARCAPDSGPAPRARLNVGPRPPLPENPLCFLPVDIGPCRGQQPKFYFDPTTSKCERFMYGGCKGNDNRFGSLRDCIATCGKHPRGGLMAPRAARIPPPPTKVCKFRDQLYNLGDVVRTGDKCVSCTCRAPPSMTCVMKSCDTPPKPEGGVGCQPVMDEDGCCQTGWVCEDDDPEDVRAVLCQNVPCPMIAFLDPPNAVCEPEFDERGCCQVGMSCVPKE